MGEIVEAHYGGERNYQTMEGSMRVIQIVIIGIGLVFMSGCTTLQNQGPDSPLTLALVTTAAQTGVYFPLRDKPGADLDRASAIVDRIAAVLSTDGKYNWEAAMNIVATDVPIEYQAPAMVVIAAVRVEIEKALQNEQVEVAHKILGAAVQGAKIGLHMAKEYQRKN